MPCSHPRRDYFYSVYTNKRICRHCWTDEPEELVSTTEDALEPMLRAMTKIAEETVKAAEAVDEFTAAYAEASEKGIGVIVVRKRDGSITSTPNVFVAKGTAIFMDEPGDWSQSIRQGLKFEHETPALTTPEYQLPSRPLETGFAA